MGTSFTPPQPPSQMVQAQVTPEADLEGQKESENSNQALQFDPYREAATDHTSNYPMTPLRLESEVPLLPSLSYTRPSRRDRLRLRVFDYVSSVLRRTWTMEVLSCTAAYITFAAIVTLVAVEDGKTLPQWPVGISLNTIMSILTTIFHAALLFPISEGISQLKWLWFNEPRRLVDLDRLDSASRGPWGSLQLLWNFGRHYLANFGAFITVLALLISPFSQQLIQYHDCMQPLVGSAPSLVSRTNNYSTGGLHVGAGQQELDGPMTVAILLGLFDPPSNSSSAITFDCPSGNCTFPGTSSVSTLAMCHTCSDISNQLVQSVNNDTSNRYSLPTGAWVNDAIEGQYANTDTNTTFSPDFVFFGFHGVFLNVNLTCVTSQNCFTPIAVQCDLIPCVKSFQVNITQMVYTEVQMDDVSDNPQLNVQVLSSEDGPGDWSIATGQTIRNGTATACNPSNHQTEENDVAVDAQDNTVIPTTGARLNISEANRVWYPSDCVYVVALEAWLGISQFMSSTLEGDLTSPYGQPDDVVGPLWLKNLYQNGTANVTTANNFMEGLTWSMTGLMRERGDTGKSGWAEGVVMTERTCIRAQWRWIVVPAISLVFATAFLIATVRTQTKVSGRDPSGSNSSGQGFWKSSIIVALFHGFSKETRDKYGTMQSRKEMKDAAEAMTVQLRHDEKDGLKFVETEADMYSLGARMKHKQN